MKFTRKTTICGGLLTAVLLLTLTGCQEKPVQKKIFAMDTVMDLPAYGKQGEQALAEAVQVINDTAAQLDPDFPDSETARLNSGEKRVTISEQTAAMMQTAATVYERSGGALDLTIYPVVETWGFIDQNYRVPEAEEIQAALTQKNFSGIELEEEGGQWYLTLPEGAELSFGAVAKGATGDAVTDTLRDAGVSGALISLGGNVQTLGQKPDGSDWRIAVQDPNDLSGYLGVLEVGETAVVTSGGYQRYFEQDGAVYHHIIDPATGYPADSGLQSVTVVCPEGVMADCLSTALFVLGEEGALEYWRTYGGFELILVTEDGRVVATSGLEGRFTPQGDTYTYLFTD